MFTVCSLTHVLRASSNIFNVKLDVLTNIVVTRMRVKRRFQEKKLQFNAWVELCKYKAFQGMVK